MARHADLGAFRLHDRLAQGGMGEVWSAVHRTSGLQCAVKLIRPDLMDEQAARDFDREVRSQARLDHPGIVHLLDHGRLEPEAAGVVQMAAGVPWVAMEHCGSSLYQVSGGLSWTGLREVLLQLLHALGHAHASGVLHRDIKMSNVLIATAEDLRPGVKLADFGVAHVLADEGETTRNVGTPRYMAPEQVHAEWEMLGPWTDLYALGVLSWRIATGKRPWGKLKGRKLAVAMLTRPLGWPGGRFAVPPDFPEWLQRMTSKVPAERFQLAADAAAALLAMPADDSEGVWLPDEFTDPDFGGLTGTLIPADDTEDEVLPRAPLVRPMEEPPPETEASIRLQAAGLGLLALRRPGLIGRRDERELAWAILRHVAQSGRAKALCVTGPAQVGRSRFMAWVGETAERAGQGVTIALSLVPGRDAGDQVVKCLRTWFRIGAMTRLDAQEHLETWLGPGDFLPDFAALLVRGEASDSAWRGLALRALVALGARRPIVLRIEGAGRHPEIETFVHALLEAERAPVFIVIDRSIDGEETLALKRLSDASIRRIADAMVGLDPEVQARLVERAAGSPGYLTATLRHWAEQGELVPGPNGFVVRGDESGSPTLSVVAASQLGAVNHALPDDALESLELAAVLGMDFDRELWRSIDGVGRGRLQSRIVECLAPRGLLEEQDGRLRFTSVPFREAILQQALPRLPSLHRRCADGLAKQGTAVAVLARGRHLLAAGDLVLALEPLREGVERVGLREGAQAGLAALAELDQAVQELLGPQRLRWRAVVDVLQAGFLIELGRERQAQGPIENALRTGTLLSDDDLRARAWARRGAAAARSGNSEQAIAGYREALDLGERIPSEELGRWWVELGRAHLASGDRQTWSVCMTAAADCAAEDLSGQSPQLVPLGRAAAARVDGRFEAALECLDEAYALASEMGSGLARLSVLRARAHTLLDAGRYEPAREVFAQALELAVQAQSSRAPIVLANAVALELRLRKQTRAHALFDRYRFLLPSGSRDASRVPLHCVAVAVAAAKGDWRRVQHHHDRIAKQTSPWGWGVLACSLVALRVAAAHAENAGMQGLARQLVALGVQRARTAGDEHPDLVSLQTTVT